MRSSASKLETNMEATPMMGSAAMAAPQPRSAGKTALIVVLAAVTLVALGIAYYFYSQWKMVTANPQQLVQKIAQDEVTEAVEKVGKLMVLPTGEQPTIATVVDPEKLKDQPFFANAKVGDKVLIYATAKKAILYDPVANKIVEVAPLNVGQ